ncbi:kinesin-8, putative [Plasmodium chabaudi chabaudi]|uniref:Kinesin-8, putative n=1 Tax=Plasmodium chabaudi chabaudi TaxID=31271 RepID=A0A4V0K6K8_PLACU|nr:kinesin-8, putative [Plasmodium chabaudi chabaudi]VTZ68268.1 kinesin-8, putative [Plasmodium chabaudi chabaudi]|eukprot:XP_016653728.1 kinesin-8, putative [Plasmodium chabaudi chabaudi]
MNGKFSNVIKRNNNDENNKKVNKVYIYSKKNKKFIENSTISSSNTNNTNNTNNTSNTRNTSNASNNSSKKNILFLNTQNEIEGKTQKKFFFLHNIKERKSIIKKKKKISHMKRLENVNNNGIDLSTISYMEENNFYDNNNKKTLRIPPEFSNTKKAPKVTHGIIDSVKKKNYENLSDDKKHLVNTSGKISDIGNTLRNNNIGGSNIAIKKVENKKSPIVFWKGDEKEIIKKNYSSNNNTNRIINYNDQTLKIFCNLNKENNKNGVKTNKTNNFISNSNDNKNIKRKLMENEAAHTDVNISNTWNSCMRTDPQSTTCIIGDETKSNAYEMDKKTNKNMLSINDNKNFMGNMNEYPITSKNIYDSIYIPQINIKNINNSYPRNNNNLGTYSYGVNNNTKGGSGNNYNDTVNNGNNNAININGLKKCDSSNLINTLNEYSNVKVAVRIRPIPDEEEKIVSIFNKNYVLIEKTNEKESYLLSQKKKQSTYVFDVVFDVNASQEEVFYHTSKPLIPHVFKGINCTVFAYGATGSGKTYTMLDDKNQNGIVQLSLLELFTIIKEKKCKNVKVLMSFLEVYNETIRDLLGKEKNKTLEVQEDVAEVKVSNLCEIEIQSYEQAMLLINEGVRNRKMSPTRANKVSSRSHAILQIYVLNEMLDSNMNVINYKAKLCFVDLAGSERASATSNKGERFKEGSYINQSLLALANCINSLASNRNLAKVRVKYRDSKLTHLLKNSLEGNCLVVMIANINPSRKCFQESNNTLKYAFRARNIKLCATVQTNDNKETDIEKILKKNYVLQKEYDSLLIKHNSLREFYFRLKNLFCLYKIIHSCYQKKENTIENVSILGLKQDISIYEQLIKIKLDEAKNKIDSINDDDDDKSFINIFDPHIHRNLNYFIHNTNFSILNEGNEKMMELLDRVFSKQSIENEIMSSNGEADASMLNNTTVNTVYSSNNIVDNIGPSNSTVDNTHYTDGTSYNAESYNMKNDFLTSSNDQDNKNGNLEGNQIAICDANNSEYYLKNNFKNSEFNINKEEEYCENNLSNEDMSVKCKNNLNDNAIKCNEINTNIQEDKYNLGEKNKNEINNKKIVPKKIYPKRNVAKHAENSMSNNMDGSKKNVKGITKEVPKGLVKGNNVGNSRGNAKKTYGKTVTKTNDKRDDEIFGKSIDKVYDINTKDKPYLKFPSIIAEEDQLQTFHNNLTDMQNSIFFNTINKQIDGSSHLPILQNNMAQLLLQNNILPNNFILDGKTNIKGISADIIKSNINISNNNILNNQNINNKEITIKDTNNINMETNDNSTESNLDNLPDEFQDVRPLATIDVNMFKMMENTETTVSDNGNDDNNNNDMVSSSNHILNFYKNYTEQIMKNNIDYKENKRGFALLDENNKYENTDENLILKKQKVKNK